MRNHKPLMRNTRRAATTVCGGGASNGAEFDTSASISGQFPMQQHGECVSMQQQNAPSATTTSSCSAMFSAAAPSTTTTSSSSTCGSSSMMSPYAAYQQQNIFGALY